MDVSEHNEQKCDDDGQSEVFKPKNNEPAVKHGVDSIMLWGFFACIWHFWTALQINN